MQVPALVALLEILCTHEGEKCITLYLRRTKMCLCVKSWQMDSLFLNNHDFMPNCQQVFKGIIGGTKSLISTIITYMYTCIKACLQSTGGHRLVEIIMVQRVELIQAQGFESSPKVKGRRTQTDSRLHCEVQLSFNMVNCMRKALIICFLTQAIILQFRL